MSKLTEDINKLKPNLVFHKVKDKNKCISTLNGKVEMVSLKDIAKMIGIDFDKMKCSRNGIKKDGESCSKNNKCTYPNCLK